MKSAEAFLANLRYASAKPEAPTLTEALPVEIRFAASLGLSLAPVLGVSRFVNASQDKIGTPTSDRDQLLRWAIEYPRCAWAMETNGVIVLEYNPTLGKHSLHELCDGAFDGWSGTLQFSCGDTRYLLFRHFGEKLREIGHRYVGIKVHSKKMLLLPPSRFLVGPQLIWRNLTASILEVPIWLQHDDTDNSGWNQPSAVPAMTPYIGEDIGLRYIYDEDFSL